MSEALKSECADERRDSKAKRLGAVALPAGVITVSLFMAMHQLVEVEDFSPPEPTEYILDAYMEVTETEEPRSPDPKPTKPVPIDPPPRPDPLVKQIKQINLPISGYNGFVPADYGEAKFTPILPERANAIQVRDLQPVMPPIPNYPDAAARQGWEGGCEVYLSVSARGEPLNVQAKCSHRAFERAARKAVQQAKFAPQIRDGLPVTVTGVVYPLEVRLER